MTVRRTVLGGIAALLAIAAGAASCSYWRDNVPFTFVDERNAPLHKGSLNVMTGQAEISVGKVRYAGVFPLMDLRGWTHSEARLQADNGATLTCKIGLRDDGFGNGQCRGPGDLVYEVTMRDTPRL